MAHTRSFRAWRGAAAGVAGVGAIEAFGQQSGFGMIDPPEPPALAGSALWKVLLLENPWPLVIVFAGMAAVLWAAFRGRRARAWWAGGPVVGAVAVYVLSALVETPGERLRARTVELVAAATRADGAALEGLLAPDAVLYVPGGGASLDRGEILSRVRDDLGGRFRVSAWAVLGTQWEAAGEEGRTQVKVRVVPEATGFPNISWWRVDWAMDPPGVWRVTRIEPVSLTPDVRQQLR